MDSVIASLDHLINVSGERFGEIHAFSETLGRYVPSSELSLAALEVKVGEWSKHHPVIWNIGIGPTASFVPTLTRVMFDCTKKLYGPYDQITSVRLPPAEAASSSAAHHRLAFEVLTEILVFDDSKELWELKKLAAEESYFGYGNLSDNLMLEAFGREYIRNFGSDQSILRANNVYDGMPSRSRLLNRALDVLGFVEGKRHLMLLENLHNPISLDVVGFILGNRRPSIFNNWRWLISTTSKDVCENSKGIRGDDFVTTVNVIHFPPEYYYAPSFDGFHTRDWAMLIKEALWDAARSIYVQQSDKGDEGFWLHVAQKCLYYGMLYHPLQQGAASGDTSCVTSDELVRCWVAENLLSSTHVLSDTLANKYKEQSNFFRSAYDAGKVIIQALKKYSLLPSSSQDSITGVSMLVEGIPRLRKDELYTSLEDNKLRFVSFLNDVGRHVSRDWWLPVEARNGMKMTTLILRGCSNISEFRLDKLLTPHLHVLDLSYTPINSLPPSFSRLLNLYLLSLRGCTHLQTLSPPPSTSDKETSPPLAHLEKLQVLDMNGVPLLELTEEDCSNKSNLHYLDLSGSKVFTLPPRLFEDMSNLEELIFGNCSNLKDLPHSIAQLSNLLVLHVEGTQITSFPEHMFQKQQSLHTVRLINNLMLMSLPMSISEAKGLKELHISYCISLTLHTLLEQLSFLENLYIQTWEGLEDIKILGHPNLRTFSICGPWVRFLSLRGCSMIKSVNFNDDLIALESVDLSGTAIVEVPHNLANLPQLNVLILLGVPSFERFPWHQLARFPRVFCLDHCANNDSHTPMMFCQKKLTYANKNEKKVDTTNSTAHIHINDPRMFHSFDEDAARKLVKEGQFLQSFSVHVHPYSVSGKKQQNNEVEQCAGIQMHSTYCDVQYLEASTIMPVMELQPKQRHIEISAVNKYPNGLRHILSITKSIFITDDSFVRCLTDIGRNLKELEECLLQRCHAMTAVFVMQSDDVSLAFPHFHSKSDGSEALSPLHSEYDGLEVFSDLPSESYGSEALPHFYSESDGSEALSHLHSESDDLVAFPHIHSESYGFEALPHVETHSKSYASEALPLLQTLQVYELNNLLSLVDSSYFSITDLATLNVLKHIHLEHCPRLEEMFPWCLSLPALETLVILFCSNLKTIFYEQSGYYHVARSPVPNIKRIYLQELPQLKHIHDHVKIRFEMPTWEKLFVRGCQSFQRLPLLKKYPETKVQVNGESEWWDRLQLKLPEQSDYYLHVAPPKFVSRKKHIIESYLR